MSASPSHPIATLSKSLKESELPFEIKDAAIPPIMNLAEAAKLVRCSRAHLCNVINGKVRGIPHLPTVRIGRRVLFRRESIEQWLRELEATGRERAAS
jgi:excisionase family DNA binding protein